MVNRGAGGLLGPLEQVFGSEGTVAGLTDAQLLDRYVHRGDPAAFEALLSRYGPLVLGVCRRRLRDGHAAEDAFQATFLVLVRKANSIRIDRSIGPWIHGVAWRVAERLRLEAAKRRDREGGNADEIAAPDDLESRRRDLAEVIDRELARLPEKYRAPIILCHLEGLTHEEAAQRLGCPPGTISIRLMRASARLRERLARRETSPAAFSLVPMLTGGTFAPPTVPTALFQAALRGTIGKGAVPAVVASLARVVLRDMMRTKIVVATVTGLASIAFVASIAALAPAFISQAPAPPLALKGRVIDERDKPIAGADVWLPGEFGSDAPEGHVVSDAEGKFSLPIDASLTKNDNKISWATIWVNAPGHTIGAGSPYKFLKGIDRSEIVVRLGPLSDTSFTVIGPDDRPVAGARVDPFLVKAPNEVYTFPAKGLSKVVGGVTDANGHVKLPALGRQGLHSVEVTSEAYGRQSLRFVAKADEPAERLIKLKAVGRIEGQILADPPELAKGVRLYFSTEQEFEAFGRSAEGQAQVTTDDQGRFVVPAIASGKLTMGDAFDDALPFRLRHPENVSVSPGETTRLELPLGPALKVRGIVRAEDTQKPLAGVTISIGYGTVRQSDEVTTGPDGSYQAYVIPGKVRLQVISQPDGYIQLGTPWANPFEVPADRGDFTFQPLDLAKTLPPILGKVVDGHDRPVVSAQVNGVSENRRYGYGKTNAAGEFELGGVPVGFDRKMSYEVGTDEEMAVAAEVIREKPLLLKVRFKAEMIKEAVDKAFASARVIDRQGQPVEGAELMLVETTYGEGNQRHGRTYDRMGRTDRDGWCRKPMVGVKGTEYHVIVQPGKTGVVASPTVKADGRGLIEFAPIVAERFVEVSGVVEDDQGRPIAGASVLNRGNASLWTSTKAQGDGTFRLGGLPTGEAFLFAEAAGFRFGGARVSIPGTQPIRLVLVPKDRPIAKREPQNPTIPRELAAELARKLVEPDREAILKGNDTNAQTDLFAALAWADPEAAWGRIRAGEKTWSRNDARLAVFHAFRRNDPATAKAVLALVTSPFYRLYGLQQLYDAMPAEPVEARKTFLEAALAESRRPELKEYRVYYFTHFAKRLAELGDLEQARALVEDSFPGAKISDAQIGRPHSLQMLADVLGRVDPEAAEALIPQLGEERGINDVRGGVAEGVAAIDPARAERLINAFTHQSSEVFTVHTCKRMARVDLPRARRMASKIKSEGLRGYAFALMAGELATTDKTAANALLDDSAKAFNDSIVRGQAGIWSSQSAAVMAASLLPVVERVNPDRVEEFTWRAVSLRWEPRSYNDLTSTIPDTSPTERWEQAAGLAFYLTGYDQDLARAVLAPVVEGFFAMPDGSKVGYLNWRLIIDALARVDPARAAELARAVPDLKESDGRSIQEAARLKIARGLVESPEEAAEQIRRSITGLEILLREDR